MLVEIRGTPAGIQGFMALLHGGEDSVPVTLDVGAIRVKLRFEPSRCEDTLTDCDFLGAETPMPIGTTHKFAMTFIVLLWTQRIRGVG